MLRASARETLHHCTALYNPVQPKSFVGARALACRVSAGLCPRLSSAAAAGHAVAVRHKVGAVGCIGALRRQRQGMHAQSWNSTKFHPKHRHALAAAAHGFTQNTSGRVYLPPGFGAASSLLKLNREAANVQFINKKIGAAALRLHGRGARAILAAVSLPLPQQALAVVLWRA